MSQTEHERSFGAAGGLAAEALVEGGTDVTGVEIKARGYWEQVWRRFRRDKVAIGSGVFIILLILVAAVGGPIAKHFLGPGPNEVNLDAGSHGIAALPVGPLSHVPCSGFAVPPTGCVGHALGTQLYILGADG